MATDWKQIKNEYEIMHVGVKELSVSHNVGVAVIEQTAKSQKWVKLDIEAESDSLEKLSGRMGALATHYEAERLLAFNRLQTKTIEVCMDLLEKVGELTDATYVKMISEVVEKLRPNVLAQQTKGVDVDTQRGGNKILIVNKFPTPQPGDADYVAPNSVILGEHARQNNGITDVAFQTIEIDLPEPGELN